MVPSKAGSYRLKLVPLSPAMMATAPNMKTNTYHFVLKQRASPEMTSQALVPPGHSLLSTRASLEFVLVH